ncbi:MAG: oxidoreductase-like domain-containing protein [Casimicrobiaceae bacterium]
MGEHVQALNPRAPSSATGDALPPRPVPPLPEQCCGSGCSRCIHDVYDEALAEWERQVAARENALVGKASALPDSESG